MAPKRNDRNSRKSLILCCLIKCFFFKIQADFCRVFIKKQHIMSHIYIQRKCIYFLGWLQDPSNREGEGIISLFFISVTYTIYVAFPICDIYPIIYFVPRLTGPEGYTYYTICFSFNASFYQYWDKQKFQHQTYMYFINPTFHRKKTIQYV